MASASAASSLVGGWSTASRMVFMRGVVAASRSTSPWAAAQNSSLVSTADASRTVVVDPVSVGPPGAVVAPVIGGVVSGSAESSSSEHATERVDRARASTRPRVARDLLIAGLLPSSKPPGAAEVLVAVGLGSAGQVAGVEVLDHEAGVFDQ